MARIESYDFGRIAVDGDEHTNDLIILPGRVVPEWWRREGHSLVLEDLGDVLEDLPEHLVVGTGAHGRLEPDRAALAELERRGVTVETMRTPEAVRRYNELNPAATAAALHLTC